MSIIALNQKIIANRINYNSFKITVKTDNVGTSANNEFLLPMHGDDFDITTSEQYLTNLNQPQILSWSSPGIYDIEVTGRFDNIYFCNSNDKLKLLSVNQWGHSKWTTMGAAFYGCDNLELEAKDVPDLSICLETIFMFRGCSKLNHDISNWDVSNVNSMRGMFYKAINFNQDISGWNVGNATDMRDMFCFAESFNQDIGGWNVSNVTDMHRMFCIAKSFNQDIGGWDVKSVNNMAEMFYGATAFDQDISGWNIENVTNLKYFMINAALSISNYDALLIAWNNLNLKDNLNVYFGNSKYTAAGEAAKNNIINNHNWTFIDGGLA